MDYETCNNLKMIKDVCVCVCFQIFSYYSNYQDSKVRNYVRAKKMLNDSSGEAWVHGR